VPPNTAFAPLRDAWIRLGVVATLLTASVVLVQLPISLWARNTAEFQSSPWQLLGLGSGVAVLAIGGAIGVLWLLPPVARRGAASAAAAVGLFVWAHGNFIGGSMSVLDGRGAPVDFAAGNPGWTMLASVIACVIIAIAVSRAPQAAAFGLTLLTIGLYATVIAAIARTPAQQRPRLGADANVYRFSSRENVLVLLLDGLQSGVAADIFRASPSIAQAFDGFYNYRDMAGVARTTFLSLPAIHSGRVYSPSRTPSAYFGDAIKRLSFMNRFAGAGFDTLLLNPVESVCPRRVRLCATASQLLDTSAARLKREGLQLVDLALFRASPTWLKRHIYNDGEWLTAGRMDVPLEIRRVLEGNALLEHLSNRLSVDDGAPTLKFVHSLSTHTPYVLNDDCQTYSPASLRQLVPQARCGLLAVVRLLDRLKEAGAYDNTLIVVMADHGVDPSAYGPAAIDRPDPISRYLAGVANPVFLMKPQGSRGPLRPVSDAVQVTDIGNMLCAGSRTCRVLAPVEPLKASVARPRLFNDYEWRQEFWSLRLVNKLTTYEIRGPVLERSSWSRLPATSP
jgi:Sulfatase